MNDDLALLRRYLDQGCDAAFCELVQRHFNLVYFAALRQTDGITHHAEDAAQATFTLLVQKAESLLCHPSLTGWLHATAGNCARDIMRSEKRRQLREQSSHALHYPTFSSGLDAEWAKVRPLIDDALLDLSPEDRDAVLLRFFESRSFGEIGELLDLGESGARMRVTRALNLLQGALSKRGLKSTGSALASVLCIPASMAAPAGLALQIASAAIATAPSISANYAGPQFFRKMLSPGRTTLAASLIVILALAAVWLLNRVEISSTQSQPDTRKNTQSELQESIRRANAQLVAQNKSANVAHQQAPHPQASIPSQNPASEAHKSFHNKIIDQTNMGIESINSHDYDAALKELLSAFEKGTREASSYFIAKHPDVIEALFRLGESYPPAMVALMDRINAFESRVNNVQSNIATINDSFLIDPTREDKLKTFGLFYSTPIRDATRRQLTDEAMRDLLESKKYSVLVAAMPYPITKLLFTKLDKAIRLADLRDSQRQKFVERLKSSAINDIEIRAGVGDLDDAFDMIEQLTALDSSIETRSEIIKRLERAGQGGLLKP